MRAPEAPTGCPSATAPPFTLTRSSSAPSSIVECFATDENASFRMLVTYWDMVGSFVTSGVLNPELFYQSGGEMLFVWERLRGLVPELREAFGNPLETSSLVGPLIDKAAFDQSALGVATSGLFSWVRIVMTPGSLPFFARKSAPETAGAGFAGAGWA